MPCMASLKTMCVLSRPSCTNEPTAHDVYWKLSNAPHACWRHPGWLWLGLHCLAPSLYEKGGAGNIKESLGRREECVCVRERERASPAISACPKAGSSLEQGALQNVRVSVIWAERDSCPVFLGNENKKKKLLGRQSRLLGYVCDWFCTCPKDKAHVHGKYQTPFSTLSLCCQKLYSVS